ncbi:hypothetical protein KFK09_007361 [Dendrobium nobile]|uniref:Uncharacterized protein n=1 Tax=Dendrobium nobile TaxID=94219 RepID=A0A8T3BTW2_DENNO|nr:hypothetical protein KFK09_007361 [Dendrobium nobile]
MTNIVSSNTSLKTKYEGHLQKPLTPIHLNGVTQEFDREEERTKLRYAVNSFKIYGTDLIPTVCHHCLTEESISFPAQFIRRGIERCSLLSLSDLSESILLLLCKKEKKRGLLRSRDPHRENTTRYRPFDA